MKKGFNLFFAVFGLFTTGLCIAGLAQRDSIFLWAFLFAWNGAATVWNTLIFVKSNP